MINNVISNIITIVAIFRVIANVIVIIRANVIVIFRANVIVKYFY